MKRISFTIALVAALVFATSIGYSDTNGIQTEQPQLFAMSSKFP